ncbi:hypothetical protein V8E51_006884 [Hyaloscypha variabilis]
MTSNNPVQCRVSKRVMFYDKHPLGPIAKGGYFKDDLARKGLKIESGEWDHNTTFTGLEGAKKRKPLIDAAKEKYGARFRWDRIPENHKDWVDRVLAKLLVLLKSTYKQEARKATLLQAADSFKVSASQVRSQSTKTSIQASLSALPPLSITPPPPPTNSGLSQKSAQICLIRTSSQSQSPTATEGMFQQMTLVVVNAIVKREYTDEQPWEDILVESLTEEGKTKAFNRLLLLSSDFSLTKLKAKLADSSQSPFGFEENLHELVYVEDFRERIIRYDAAWRTVLQ